MFLIRFFMRTSSKIAGRAENKGIDWEKTKEQKTAYSSWYNGKFFICRCSRSKYPRHEIKCFCSKKAIQKYPPIQRFCADAGDRNGFEKDVESQLKRGADISTRKKNDWEIIPKRCGVERTLSWFNKSRQLSKNYEFFLISVQYMCMIAAFHTLISRF